MCVGIGVDHCAGVYVDMCFDVGVDVVVCDYVVLVSVMVLVLV